MIDFPCKCGHALHLGDEWAGSLTQCPACGRAVPVPTLSELALLDTDGTFVLDEPPARPESGLAAVERMYRAFSPHTVDLNGREKDMRGPVVDASDDDEEEIDLAPSPRPARVVPRYDPVTGERIRPLELRDDTPAPVLPVLPVEDDPSMPLEAIPLPAEPVPVDVRGKSARHLNAAPQRGGRALGYATGGAARQLHPATLALELLMPASAVVMLFVFFAYLLSAFLGSLLGNLSSSFASPLVVLDVPLWLIAAHYGCVIEETGPNALDELPRPLRNFNLSEDLINPLLWVGLSVVICFFPALLATAPKITLDHQVKVILALVLGLIGSLFFPAVLLTAVTGTTFANLRPDRVLGVILATGGEYLLSVGIFVLAVASGGLYLFPALADHLHLQDNEVLKHLTDNAVALPLILLSVYLGHFFCWHLGLLYRAHHDAFPWILQRHIRTRRDAAAR